MAGLGMTFFTVGLFLALSVLTGTTVEAQRNSFGEACNETVRCDKRAWLTCRNGSCDCMKPDVMMYDETLKKCASKAGERCKFILEEFDTKENSDKDRNIAFELIDCVPNSRCGSDGFCTCNSKFYESSNGTCILAQSHLQPCNFTVKCSTFEALLCKNGVCQCDQSTSVYGQGQAPMSQGLTVTRDQCVGLAGEECINTRCVDHATCVFPTIDQGLTSTLPSTCQCKLGYYQDENKRCQKKVQFLGPCLKDGQCAQVNGSQLVCLNGECQCDPKISRFGRAPKSVSFATYKGRTSYYNNSPRQRIQGEEFTQCLGLAGRPCLDQMCVPNSYCQYSDSTQSDYEYGSFLSDSDPPGICTCLSDYRQSRYGTCGLGYGRECYTYGSCLDGLRCDFSERRCRCPYSEQRYDSSKEICISLINGPCNSTMGCPPDAECRLFSNGPAEAGHCVCKKGFITNGEMGCDIAFGYPCTHSSQSRCDNAARLGCFDETCQCKPFSRYSDNHRKCLGLVGANCDLQSSDYERECVEGSKCARNYPRLPWGTCSCLPGFEETTEFTCVPLNVTTTTTTAWSYLIHDEE